MGDARMPVRVRRGVPRERRAVAGVWLTAVLAASSMVRPAAAQEFFGLGFLPGGDVSYAAAISADGEVVAGSGWSAYIGDFTGFRWTRAEGMEELALPVPDGRYAYATGMSSDGSVVVGRRYLIGAPIEACIWTSDGANAGLGWLPGVEPSWAFGVSGDGSVVVGVAGELDFSSRAFRWTDTGGMQDLGTLPGYSIAQAFAADDDGSVVVGVSAVYFHIARLPYEAFRWTSESGMESLGAPRSIAYGVNHDGSIVVGQAYFTDLGVHACRWTRDEGVHDLGALPGDFSFSTARGVSDDGTVVVGWSFTDRRHAILWTEATGLVDLNVYLPSLGIDLSGWWLERANAVSADGHRIVGDGVHDGLREGWVVDLGGACAADFDGSGSIDSRDFFSFLTAFFGAQAAADFNADGVVDSMDFFEFVAAFLAGC